MFSSLSFKEFREMMQKGVNLIFNTPDNSNEKTQTLEIIHNINIQPDITDDQTQDYIKGN